MVCGVPGLGQVLVAFWVFYPSVSLALAGQDPGACCGLSCSQSSCC